MHSYRNNNGFTLVEMLVVAKVSSVILVMFCSVYSLNNKDTYEFFTLCNVSYE